MSGGRAWYQGAGIVTINGSSQPAEFLVAAEDGPSFTQDMLRMKIWTAAGVIYDSQPGGVTARFQRPRLRAGPNLA